MTTRVGGGGAFELSDVPLETENLRPQSVAFIDQLIQALAKSLVVRERAWRVGRVDQPGGALALPSSVCAHPLCVRCPLAGPAHSSLSAHDSRRCDGHVTDHYPSHYPTGSQRMMSIASSVLSAKCADVVTVVP